MRTSLTLLLAAAIAIAQAMPPPDAAPLRETTLVAKLFPLLAAIGDSNDEELSRLLAAKKAALQNAAGPCGPNPECIIPALQWSEEEIKIASAALLRLYNQKRGFAQYVDGPLRRSGVYIRWAALPGDQLVERAWNDAATNINRILDVYGLGKAPRYPAIDSVSFEPGSDTYKRLLHIEATVLAEDLDNMNVFFEPSLRYALAVMKANRRDEAERFEPLHEKENKPALTQVSKTGWAKYLYSVIVVPGSGTDRIEVSLSPWAVARLKLAAKRYREGKVPFLLVSGGFVHPNQTPHCEAAEMKKSLMRDHGIPENAIFIEPHARHTTTNLRNAARMIYRYGLPFDKPSLITTDLYQSLYIQSPVFEDRCLKELGYLPYSSLKRVTSADLEWKPMLESLHTDPADPLDP